MDSVIAASFFEELMERKQELLGQSESQLPDLEAFAAACSEILDDAGMLSEKPEFVLVDRPGHRVDAICYPSHDNHRVFLLSFLEQSNFDSIDGKSLEKEALSALNRITPLIRGICSATKPAGLCEEVELMQRRIRAITPMPDAIVLHIVTNALSRTRSEIEKKLNANLDRILSEDAVIHVKFTDLKMLHSYRSGAVHGASEEFEVSGRDAIQCIKVHSGLDHDVFLAAFPARVIARIVKKHGQLLYQKNVRAFLGLRGKTNKRIVESVRKLPHHFLALNNGVTMTVSGLDCIAGAATTYLKSASDIQIVNGGQTTRTLENEYRENDGDCLSEVRIFAKIVHVKVDDTQGSWIDRIAETSNTQNAIKVTDLGAANPVIKKIKELADTTVFWKGTQNFNWFFARLKNEYTIELDHRKGPSKFDFKRKFPKEYLIKNKSELLIADRIFLGKPWRAAQGESKCHEDFLQTIPDDFVPDHEWYRTAIGRVIVVRAAADIAKKLGVKEGRSSVVQYACALLAVDGADSAAAAARNQEIDERTRERLSDLVGDVKNYFDSMSGEKSLKEHAKLEKTWIAMKDHFSSKEVRE